MKITPGRMRVLKALSLPEAFAFPSGKIPIQFSDWKTVMLDESMAFLFEKNGWIERSTPPKEAHGYVFVWKITDSGRAGHQAISNQHGENN